MPQLVDRQLHRLVAGGGVRPEDLQDVAIDEAQLVAGDAVEEALVGGLDVPRVEDGLN